MGEVVDILGGGNHIAEQSGDVGRLGMGCYGVRGEMHERGMIQVKAVMEVGRTRVV